MSDLQADDKDGLVTIAAHALLSIFDELREESAPPPLHVPTLKEVLYARMLATFARTLPKEDRQASLKTIEKYLKEKRNIQKWILGAQDSPGGLRRILRLIRKEMPYK